MPNTRDKRRQQRKGFYLSLRDVQCDCGLPATHQVQIAQHNANGNNLINVIPLCDGCYELMLKEDTGILQAA